MNPNQPYGYGPPPYGGYGGAYAPPGQAAPQRMFPANEGCQRCGVQIETKHVHFRQNIGLLVTRLVKQAQGNLCKACIRDIGFKYTLVTLFFGWWGMISFFVTLFILPSNVWQLFSARNLPEVPGRPKPTGLYVLMLLLGLFIGLFTALFVFVAVASEAEASTKNTGGTVGAIIFFLLIGGVPAALLLVSSLRGLLSKPA